MKYGRDAGSTRQLADLPLILCLGMLLRVTFWYLTFALPLTFDFATGGATGRSLPAFQDVVAVGQVAQIAGVGTVVPLVQSTLTLALLAVFGGGLVWTVHLWSGAPVAASIRGLSVAVLAVPPAFVREATPRR